MLSKEEPLQSLGEGQIELIQRIINIKSPQELDRIKKALENAFDRQDSIEITLQSDEKKEAPEPDVSSDLSIPNIMPNITPKEKREDTIGAATTKEIRKAIQVPKVKNSINELSGNVGGQRTPIKTKNIELKTESNYSPGGSTLFVKTVVSASFKKETSQPFIKPEAGSGGSN